MVSPFDVKVSPRVIVVDVVAPSELVVDAVVEARNVISDNSVTLKPQAASEITAKKLWRLLPSS